jgi:hypothetical protein
MDISCLLRLSGGICKEKAELGSSSDNPDRFADFPFELAP